jgi:hypothetical protein
MLSRLTRPILILSVALLPVSCSAAGRSAVSREPKGTAGAPATQHDPLESSGSPMHVWEAGPGVKDAPTTRTRPYTPRP